MSLVDIQCRDCPYGPGTHLLPACIGAPVPGPKVSVSRASPGGLEGDCQIQRHVIPAHDHRRRARVHLALAVTQSPGSAWIPILSATGPAAITEELNVV